MLSDTNAAMQLKTRRQTATGMLVTALLATLLTPPVHAKMYKWVDEQGNVTYSQQKPPNRKAQTIELKGIESPDPAATKKLEAMQDKADTARKDREFTQTETEALKEREARIKHNCEVARENVRILTSSMRIQETKPDGTKYYLDEEGVAAKLREAEGQVENFCE